MSDDCKDLQLMDKIVSLCKRRGFIFPSSEIYGGFNGFWDYGPYGSRMKRAIENLWWREMVETRDNVEGLDYLLTMGVGYALYTGGSMTLDAL